MGRCPKTSNGKHIPGCGCPEEPKPRGRALRTTGSGQSGSSGSSGSRSPRSQVPAARKGHVHNYVTKKVRTGQDDEHLILYEDKECQNPGCNQPRYTEETRTPKTRKHTHQFEVKKTWTRRGVTYLRYKCRTCPETYETHT